MSSKKSPEILSVSFTLNAEIRLIKLLDYIEEEWSLKTREKVWALILKNILRVKEFPFSCPESKFRKGIYQCVVSKQTSFYYRINKTELEIISIFDNRQKEKNRS